MRLVSFSVANEARIGLVVESGVMDLTVRRGIASMTEAIDQIADLGRIGPGIADHAIDRLEFLPVVPDPRHIFCVGLNYRSHLEETGRDPPSRPMIFARFGSSQVGHQQPIVRPKVSEMLDFEGELAVIIGKACRYVPSKEAMSVVAGYAVYNDGSVRDWQRHSTQFTPGKNFPATGAFGPYLVTKDEIEDPANLSLVTRLNGVEMQRAVIGDLIFDIPTLIEYCSTFTPLSVGDVIVTGTTGGVGSARNPPVWMKPGDCVEVEIDRVGLLRNPVIAEE